MSVSTIATKQNSIPTFITYGLGIIGIGLVVFFGGEVIKNIDNLKGKAGVSIQATNADADIYINDKFVGKTPYEATNIKPGQNKVAVKTADREYQTTIDFLSNSNNLLHVVGIVRDLGVSDNFSSGQDFWFEKDDSGNVLRVITEPPQAKVFLDGAEIGTSPFLKGNVSEGDYELKVTLPGYETQTTRINIKKGYVLNASTKLFPMPIPQPVSALTSAGNFYDLSTDNDVVASDTQSWVKAIIYWNKTRGINVDNVGDNKGLIFDFYLDYKGNMFNADGNPVTTTADMAALKNYKKGAYLGKKADGGLSSQAKDALTTLLGSAAAIGGKQATIKATPTGWLRVRDNPTLSGVEVTRVDTGGSYLVEEEKTGWVKIKISDTVEGWVSSDYVTIK